MSHFPSSILDRVVRVLATRLPADIEPSYFEGFVERNRGALSALLERVLPAPAPPAVAPMADDSPDLWSAADRTRANLAAMHVAASKRPDEMTAEDKRTLAGYSGWGGLSIRDVAERFPAGFPVPEARGLIHEYYTPTKVVREVARVVRPLLAGLPTSEGKVLTLEPSAGIGRFVRAFEDAGALRWLTVEYSALSARMLQAIRSDLAVYEGPFERWVREHGADYCGKLGLVVANPPYGERGPSATEDPAREYRERRAYAYFLRRALDLLAPGGLGVFLIPAGFLTGTGTAARELREKVLRRHHLATAYRLPSGIFPGAELVTDLLFFRSRGGEIAEVDPADAQILDGGYFQAFPTHILGVEKGKDGGEDDQTKTPRWGYQVVGTFERLPEIVERPVCAACQVVQTACAAPTTKRARAKRTAVSQELEWSVFGLTGIAAEAATLGVRVAHYLRAVADETQEEAAQLWPELFEALKVFAAQNGNPWQNAELKRSVAEGNDGVTRFLQAYTKGGELIPGLSAAPHFEPRFGGRIGDVVALAEFLYRQNRRLTLADLDAGLARFGLPGDTAAGRLLELLDARWGLVAGNGSWDVLEPEADFLSGDLYAKHDAARELLDDADAFPLHGVVPQERITAQAKRLMDTIAPAVYEDIEAISPRQGWVPLELVSEWMAAEFGGKPKLIRQDGLVQIEGQSYGGLDDDEDDDGPAWRAVSRRTTMRVSATAVLGWINHDKDLFRVPRAHKRGGVKEDLDEARRRHDEMWETSFRAFVGASEKRKAKIETAYNRAFKRMRERTYSTEPLQIARWVRDGVRLKAHQVRGARRVLENRGGLLAFDVGVGKTYTGIAVVARARQEGWVRRPVICVPNSIAWKWEADFRRVLPDYRVLVIGSKKKTIASGPRKGVITSETDTPDERGAKWTRFQAGEPDVVLLTYTALARTRMDADALREYADATLAIARQIALRKKTAKKKSRGDAQLTERQEAILQEGTAAWIAEQLELPKGWEYDPGPSWDEIGIDFLGVDEAQNFKNLYLPEDRGGGVPRFIGNAGEGSARAWHLDFRTASVRRRTGGTGIMLLSATPAKNSPLELYSLIQYVDHEAWSRAGIYDSEQFIDRFLQLEPREVVTSSMEVTTKLACVGFQNLHELRSIIFRYAEFKTAEDVGLQLPEPRVQFIEVDLDPEQEEKYADYVGKIEKLAEGTRGDKGQILGLLARLALIAIHPALEDGYDWKTAATSGVNPHSPKFDALAERIAANRTCGHIVFCDNVAAHRWIMQVLVAAGLDESRIAVLNAETAKASADRQRIAQEFNGDAENGIAPRFDVVIANAIAYEGIDLQTRTCAIHHVDLPWEPATLQQRNGRGVRQGNTLAAIDINYYFARRSQDGLRFNLIQGKRGWMTALIAGQDRKTNNPGAQLDLSPEDVLLLVSRDPEKTRERMAEAKAKREADAKKKLRQEASSLLKRANARFRTAERRRDNEMAQRLRLEGEELLKSLSLFDADVWPWIELAYHARERYVYSPEDGSMPVYEGLRFGVADAGLETPSRFIEVGKVEGGTKPQIGFRYAGTTEWNRVTGESWELVTREVRPEHLAAPWPTDDRAQWEASVEKQRATAEAAGGYSARIRIGEWRHASEEWLEAAWAIAGAELAAASLRYSWGEPFPIPYLAGGALRIATRTEQIPAQAVPLSPGERGWATFLALAPASGYTFAELGKVASTYFERVLPNDVLTRGKADEKEAPAEAKVAEPNRGAARGPWHVVTGLVPDEVAALHPPRQVRIARANLSATAYDIGGKRLIERVYVPHGRAATPRMASEVVRRLGLPWRRVEVVEAARSL